MWSDREADHDFLGYASYVSVLADICTHRELAPLTLGVFGSWGSGKTSLMRMLKARLDADAPKTRTRTLWFNAWRYEGRDEAQSALIHAILAKLAEDRTLYEKARGLFDRLKKGASVMKVAKVIGKSVLTLTPKVDELIDCFKDESEKLAETMEAFDRDFGELLAKADISRIVVFIDDLDRCSSTKVIETFETIKLFLNTPSSTFVIGADAAKIEQAVGDVYKVTEGRRQKDYLEKIVQIPFNIPEQDLRDISCYVGMLVVGRHLPAEHWPRLIAERPAFYRADRVEDAIRRWPADNRAVFVAGSIDGVVADLDGVMPYAASLGRGLRGNPRQIKRFLNILGLRQLLAAQNDLKVDQGVLVKLTVLEYVWPDFFNAVVETADPTTGRSPLIEEVARAAADGTGKPPGSKLVADALAQPGLVDYLLLRPTLDGTADLSPYLFLAQTSLSRERLPGIVPIDEQARGLAAGIQSDDQLRSKTAAKRAAALDAAGASAVVRLLLADLAAAKDVVPRTHILNGLTEVCQKHRDQFPAAVRSVEQLDASGQDAVAIAAGAFLDEATRCGTAVPDGLKERFAAASPLAAALAPRKGGKPGGK